MPPTLRWPTNRASRLDGQEGAGNSRNTRGEQAMRIAAGVILIIVAVINLFAAMGYFTLGGAGKLGAMVAEQQAKTGQEMTAENKESLAKLDAATKQLGASGSAL